MMPHADQLARDTAGIWHGGKASAWTGWAIDSRALRRGEIFVALRTERRDGHDFVAAAAAAGAAAAVVAQPVAGVELPQLVVADPALALAAAGAAERRRFSGPVIGVTGSCGKTSTKDLLGLVMGGAAVHRTAGNLNNQLGVPLTLLGLRPEHTAAVVEAGMNEPGEMAKLASWLAPDVAVVTMVGPVHLERLGSVAAVAHEKAELVRGLRAGGFAVGPCALLEWDDFRREAGRLVTVDAAPEGTPERADAGAWVRWQAEGTMQWRLRWRDGGSGEGGEARLPRVSAGQLGNAGLALVTGSRLGCSPAEMAAPLADWQPDRLRGSWCELDGRRWYVDCYNASPVSLQDAALCFAEQCPSGAGGRVWVLGTFGELGADAARWHEQAGRALPVGAGDRALLVGPEPMTAALAHGLRAAGLPAVAIQAGPDVAAVAAALAATEGPIFLKGSRMHRLEILLPAAFPPDLSHVVVSG